MRGLEKRLQRRRVRLGVTFWEPGKESDYRAGHIVNLSESGAFIMTDTPVAPPARLNLRLVLDEKKVDVPCEVVRSIGETQFTVRDSGSGMGVRFLDAAAPDTLSLVSHGTAES